MCQHCGYIYFSPSLGRHFLVCPTSSPHIPPFTFNMPVWVEDHGFDSAACSLYGQTLVWEEDGTRREGTIFFSTSLGAVLLHTSSGERKMMR